MSDQSLFILMLLLSFVISLLVVWLVMMALKKAGHKNAADKEAERKKLIKAMWGRNTKD